MGLDPGSRLKMGSISSQLLLFMESLQREIIEYSFLICSLLPTDYSPLMEPVLTMGVILLPLK